MTLQHLPRTTSAEDALACLDEHGYVIIDELAPIAVMDQIEADMDPFVKAAPFGEHHALGLRTQRAGRLMARSPAARDLVMNDLLLGIARGRLAHAATMQLAFTEIIALHPTAEAQFVHRDEMLYDAFPFPRDYEVYVNSLWALTDYTEEMGATRVVPGSHRADRSTTFTHADTVAAEMTRGSALILSGKLVHCGGHNRSDRVRKALDLGFSVGWVRQEENQYLACPPDVARTLPTELLTLMGYDAAHGYGHMGRDHPLTALGRG